MTRNPKIHGRTRPHGGRGRRALTATAMALVATLALASCWSPSQDKVLRQVNATRSASRLGTVRGDEAAMRKAQLWSAHMARTGVLQHTGGGGRLDTSGLTRWCGVAENVGYGSSTDTVHASFLRSPGHRANIMGRYDRAGVGVRRVGKVVWVTQIFIRSC